MSDLIDNTPEGVNTPEFTVTEISGAIKRMIEGEFARVRVRGEIGRVSRPRSGHVYLDLKDERSVLAGVIWKGVAARLATRPEEGMEVIATGRLTTFAGQSKYQMVIEEIAPAGVGALMAMLERRKVKLAAEGLFEASRKRPLPYLPEVIGVVTSPSGAVIRDILHRLRERFARRVLVWPVAVQGKGCAPQVAAAIRGFNALAPGGAIPRPDLMIVARGGGSLEDLWGFNEEEVARAAAASAIPLISAVGHETDTTLIDYAADRRAPTPTAAAEIAVPVRLELIATLGQLDARLGHGISQGVARRRQRLADLARALPRPEMLLEAARQRLDSWGARLTPALSAVTMARRARYRAAAAVLRPGLLGQRLRERGARIDDLGARLGPALGRRIARAKAEMTARTAAMRLPILRQDIMQKHNELQMTVAQFSQISRSRLASFERKLEALERMRQTLGYRETLRRGYAVVRADGMLITGKDAAARAPRLELEFHDGRVTVAGASPRHRAKAAPPEQGDLF